MAQQFSDETQLLLDRAQRAIDDSLKLFEIGAQQLARARRHTFDLEENYFGFCRALEPPKRCSRRERTTQPRR